MNISDRINPRSALSVFSAVFLLLRLGEASAYSGIGEALVRQVGELPCFAIPDKRETRKNPVAFDGLAVGTDDQSPYNWAVDQKMELIKQGVRLHITPDQCIVYGEIPDGMSVAEKMPDGLPIGVPASPLQTGVIYGVSIYAYPNNGNSPIRGYHRAFCLVKTAENNIRVIEIESGVKGKNAHDCLQNP